MEDNYNKRALAYSFLAHIKNSGTLLEGTLDIFVPIVKKGLGIMSKEKGECKGESINEIREIIIKEYDIDIPIPTLRILLSFIAKEVNINEQLFVLYNDDSFLLKKYVFDVFDVFLNNKVEEINNLQKLFEEFCKVNDIMPQSNSIIKFIETNRMSLSHYIADKAIDKCNDYTIEAKFVSYFKNSPSVYDEIKDIYLGSIICCLLEYKPTTLKVNVNLLLDTNFIVSLLDLNTSESTLTCRKLIEIGQNLGFTLLVLTDTIDEIQGLLSYKIANFDKSIIQKFVNKEDVYNACSRRKLSKVDLERINDNLENSLKKIGISIIYDTEKLKNKAKYSKEYKLLQQCRNSQKSALHDAMCLIYVKEKRKNKKIYKFENANCWFVNNAISHDFDNEGIEKLLATDDSKALPEIIKVDDLLNILWLSNPSIGILNDETVVNIGLTSLVAFSLNKSLPKARIIEELDDNIQKYKNETITEKDVFLLSIRIADGQIRNIEQINELANSNAIEFNKAVKEEANKQNIVEQARNKKLEELISNYESIYSKLKKDKEQTIQEVQNVIQNKDLEINKLKKEIIKEKNKRREKDRNEYIKSRVKIWRRNCWIRCSIVIALIIAYSLCVSFWREFANIVWLNNLIVKIVLAIISIICLGDIVRKYFDEVNINAFKKNIGIPEEMQNINEDEYNNFK